METQQSMNFETGNPSLPGPGIERRGFDVQLVRQLFDRQQHPQSSFSQKLKRPEQKRQDRVGSSHFSPGLAYSKTGPIGPVLFHLAGNHTALRVGNLERPVNMLG